MNDRPHVGAKTIKFLEKQCSIDGGWGQRKYPGPCIRVKFLKFSDRNIIINLKK